MNRKDIERKINRIKEADSLLRKAENEKLQKRDDVFTQVLQDVDNNYDMLVGMIKIARFTMFAEDALVAWKLNRAFDDLKE